MTTNPKCHLKSEFTLFRTLIWQMLAKFSGVESERTTSKFTENNKKFLWFVHPLHKAFAWNEEVSCRSRTTMAKKCTKKRDARAKPLSLLKLPIALIQKFWYHGNVTSHLSCLLDIFLSPVRVPDVFAKAYSAQFPSRMIAISSVSPFFSCSTQSSFSQPHFGLSKGGVVRPPAQITLTSGNFKICHSKFNDDSCY